MHSPTKDTTAKTKICKGYEERVSRRQMPVQSKSKFTFLFLNYDQILLFFEKNLHFWPKSTIYAKKLTTF